MLTGAPQEGTNDGKVDPTDTPLSSVLGVGNPHHYGNSGGSALVSNALGQPWQGDYVFNSGDLVLDLLHNFFLESGARMGKIRVYEMTDHPTARAMLGYLLVRGGVHQVAYAKALEEVTGADVTKMLNIPAIENDKFPETKQHRDSNSHRTLYRFSPDDFKDIDKVWKAPIPTTARKSSSGTAHRRADSRWITRTRRRPTPPATIPESSPRSPSA